MKRAFAMIGIAVCCSSFASADMIEVKGEGLLNGRVLSQDEREVKFQDPNGKTRIIKREDVSVLFVEVGGSNMGKKGGFTKIKDGAERMFHNVVKFFRSLKGKTDAASKKMKDAASKPLDRSGADAKAAQLNRAMEEAAHAAAAGTNKVSTFNKEVARQQGEAKGSSGSSKGRFESL